MATTIAPAFRQLPNGKWTPIDKPAGVAKDTATAAAGSLEWFKTASESEVAAYMGKRRNKALDAAADKEIAAMLPVLKVFALDDAAAEAKALGLEGEEEDEDTELRRGEVTGNDEEEMTIADRIAASYRSAKQFWKRSTTRQRQRSQFAGSTGRYPSATATDSAATAKPSKHDLVAANAKAAKQTSMFKRF